MKRILIFYSELMPYNIPVITELTSLGYYVYIIRHDKRRLTPYNPPQIPMVEYYNRSEYSINAMLDLMNKIRPCLVMVSGWMDKGYCLACMKYLRKHKIPIVAASDTQWLGGKQWLNIILFNMFRKFFFTHIFVAGIWQYEYARRLGFQKNNILLHSLSADTAIFERARLDEKKNKIKHNLLYIGRLTEIKGLMFLLKAWTSIEDKRGWTLTLVGSGHLKEELENHKDIIVKDFMSQEMLLLETENSAALVLPSIKEPWALVLHEAAAAGLPIVATNVCGAVPYFAINGYNAFICDPGSVNSLKLVLEKLINTDDDKLFQMGVNSRVLSRRINPQIVASSLVSIL